MLDFRAFAFIQVIVMFPDLGVLRNTRTTDYVPGVAYKFKTLPEKTF